jgi:hypothetical protein
VLTEPKRNRYFHGKLLDVGHLELEQAYGKDKRWLLNRLTLGTGVLCGLAVAAVDDTLRIGSGVAVDGRGREIVVPGTFTIDPFAPAPPCEAPGIDPDAPGPATLWLCYRECFIDYTAAAVSSCHGQEHCEPGTVVESFSFRLTRGTPPPVESDLCERLRIGRKPTEGQPPVDVSVLLCQLLAGDCPDPPRDDCIPIATVEILAGRRLGAVDECAVRPRIYSQTVLLDLILCLIERVEKCCAKDSLRVDEVELVTTGSLTRPLTDPATPITATANEEPTGFRIRFSRAVEPKSVTIVTPAAPADAASLLVVRRGVEGSPAVPVEGGLTWEAPQTLVWRAADGTLPPGTYDVTGFGDPPTGQRPAISAADDQQRLDGEPTALPSGDGTEGGNFTFVVDVEPAPARPLQIDEVILVTGTQAEGRLEDPARPIVTNVTDEPFGLRLVFNRAVAPDSVTVYDAVPEIACSLLVTRTNADGTPEPVRGSVSWGLDNVALWRVEGVGSLQPGHYDVTAFGDPAPQTRRPAILAADDGQRLDGEPAGLPSGDGTEGGNFTFAIDVNPVPSPTLRITEVLVVTGANADVRMEDPAEAINVNNNVEPLGFRMTFSRRVEPDSVTFFEASPEEACSLLVVRVRDGGNTEPVAGSVRWESDTRAFWRLEGAGSLRIGRYRVTAFGDPDPDAGRPAISAADDVQRLDGEPTALPTGDGTEGGNFTFEINVFGIN